MCIVYCVIARHGGQAVSNAGLARVVEGICAQRRRASYIEYEYLLALAAQVNDGWPQEQDEVEPGFLFVHQ